MPSTAALPSIGQRLVALIRAEPAAPAQIASLLDGLTLGERVAAIDALGGADIQRRLYAASAGAPPVTLRELIPSSTPPLEQVIFHGKNSLPAFTRFQKRLCRPPTTANELWGYNHQALAWITGPGYFVVHEDATRGAALDYRELPATPPVAWPAVRPNDRGLSRFIYNGLVDYLRRVSRDVFVGSAFRKERELGNFFVLCRDPETGRTS
jgi:hypothetical protein